MDISSFLKLKARPLFLVHSVKLPSAFIIVCIMAYFRFFVDIDIASDNEGEKKTQAQIE